MKRSEAKGNRAAVEGSLPPTLETNGWELESAEERHATAPATFVIPSREERETVSPGTMVKLLFLFNGQEGGRSVVDCERMWVTVLSTAQGQYSGRLESLPAGSTAVAPGQILTFGPEHIAGVLVPKTDSRHPDHRPTSWWRRLLRR
jgi:hypothetical protein